LKRSFLIPFVRLDQLAGIDANLFSWLEILILSVNLTLVTMAATVATWRHGHNIE
jgi:hypothetical protein